MQVYADNAATTRMHQTAIDTMTYHLNNTFGNPSSLYTIGQQAKEVLETARADMAACFGAQPREIYFTSGGSEADNQAITSAAYLGARKGKKHIISTTFEHHAVLHTLKRLEKQGFEVTLLDVHADGLVSAQQVADAIRDDTCLVTIMFANNEIGTIQPIEAIGAVCHERGVLFHTDAVQAAGHVKIDVNAMHIDMLSLSAHKFHGPKAMPSKPQVAVFDTAFHMTMPPKAYRYAIPTKYYTEDHLRRYGFHGTSHRFVSKRCIELMGGVENAHRVIVCHLGNGSSLSAVKDGKCQDTSMGLSPLAGVPMGTRAGDIDTCVAQFIMNKYNMSADDCLTMLNKKSGVLALSDGVSSDFRDLDAAAEKGNEAAQLALDKFAYEVRKYIGAYAAALGGVDCIVFTAGVGENSSSMRASICDGLEYLGVKLDAEKNKLRGEEVIISTSDSKVTVWVIPTNEELMIAQDTAALTK